MNKPLPTEFPDLQLLKLGGSLITDKTQPRTARLQTISRLAEEISAARSKNPHIKLIVGHGAGSFAHVPAKLYGTRQGVRSQKDWQGFVEVWRDAVALNHLVMKSFHEVGLPAICLPPSASLTASAGRVHTWHLDPIRSALKVGLIPVIYGDVIFDHQLGGTILSTEDLFRHLARNLHPERLLLAGLEPGVWADYPACTILLPKITPANMEQITAYLGESNGTDVTGGMANKVTQMVELVQQLPHLKVLIFSGEKSGVVRNALLGDLPGTLITNPPAAA
ncbi:MAG: isopentenyl phosphate kinase family protein [Anaerolineales bacterium]|nr:isopentenyl phosphate kinase family protein [Anaerolineales bacterium]